MTAYLTVAQVAERWACSRTYVRERIADGALPALRDGRLVRVAQRSVVEWEQRHTTRVAS